MSYPTDVDGVSESENAEQNINNSQTMALVENAVENEFAFSLSRTLYRQLQNMAKDEGISSANLISELLTEGIARRVMEDETRPAPSHLMTRNGYVQDQPNAQPSMSHHSFTNHGNSRDGNSYPRNNKNFQKYSGSRQQNQNRHSNHNRNHQNNGSFFKNHKKSEP